MSETVCFLVWATCVLLKFGSEAFHNIYGSWNLGCAYNGCPLFKLPNNLAPFFCCAGRPGDQETPRVTHQFQTQSNTYIKIVLQFVSHMSVLLRHVSKIISFDHDSPNLFGWWARSWEPASFLGRPLFFEMCFLNLAKEWMCSQDCQLLGLEDSFCVWSKRDVYITSWGMSSLLWTAGPCFSKIGSDVFLTMQSPQKNGRLLAFYWPAQKPESNSQLYIILVKIVLSRSIFRLDSWPFLQQVLQICIFLAGTAANVFCVS